eukprot:5157248-Pyramimonas_sp.AAC.1
MIEDSAQNAPDTVFYGSNEIGAHEWARANQFFKQKSVSLVLPIANNSAVPLRVDSGSKHSKREPWS